MTSIDISKRKIQGKCDLKCAYSFQYPISSSTLTNKGIYLSLSYDANTMAPVTYNTQPYSVSQIHIYSPSLHLFNGQKTTAEIIVIHSPQKGGDNLYVAIPIMSNESNQTTATIILSDIVNQASTSAPSEGDSVVLSLPSFSLNDMIPSKKPFYSYTGNNVNNDYNTPYIVYGQDSPIFIPQDIATKLSSIIMPLTMELTGDILFINDQGANSLSANQTGDIYISCEPTNSSKEEVETTTTTTNSTKMNWSDIFKNPAWKTVLQIIIAFIVCIAVFYLFYWGFNKIIGVNVSIKKGGAGAGTGGGNAKHVRFAYPISKSKKIYT